MTPEERNRLTREANLRIPGAVKPTADALIRLCELNDAYIDAVIAELPTVEGVKSFDWGSDPYTCHDKCNHAVHFKSYTPREISDIERAFRAAVGSAAVNALLDDEDLWIALAAGINAEGEGSPLPPARDAVGNITAEWAYEQAKRTWNENYRRFGQEWANANPLSPSALSITSETGWLNRMNKEGYKLVRDKIKLEYLPRIKEIIGTQAAEQVPWNQIASNLRKEMQFGKRWDWVRLVRTEMKHSSYVAQMEQYEATGIPFVRWSASRAGNTCKQCQDLNGQVFRINTGKNMLFAESDYDPESESLQVCPPPVHPQCRCVQIPVWGKKKVKVPSAMEFRAQQGL